MFRLTAVGPIRHGPSLAKRRTPSFRHFCKQANKNTKEDALNEQHLKVGYITAALAVAVFGVSYASVPLYKVFCSMTGFGGTTQRVDDEKATSVKPVSVSLSLLLQLSAHHSHLSLSLCKHGRTGGWCKDD